jgi:hypothetical protein
MNKILLFGWSLLPIAGLAWHFGPGQDRLLLDEVAALVAAAESAAEAENWADAGKNYDEALKKLPAGNLDAARHLRLERAKTRMHEKQMRTAQEELAGLVDELEADATAGPALQRAAREALANSQFYMTWIMRLEGQPRDIWEPEIEGARQNYRLLAEHATAARDSDAAQRSMQDLETAVRLSRLDIKDLQGLPLPSQ